MSGLMAMIQLLLGNIGMPGGGVNALRGESNVQGATEWRPVPSTCPDTSASRGEAHPTLAAYNEQVEHDAATGSTDQNSSSAC